MQENTKQEKQCEKCKYGCIYPATSVDSPCPCTCHIKQEKEWWDTEVENFIDLVCVKQAGRPMAFNVSPTLVENHMKGLYRKVSIESRNRALKEAAETARYMSDKNDYTGKKWPKETQIETDGFNTACRSIAQAIEDKIKE